MRYDSDCPQILRDFLAYHETIKGQSPKTISEYYLDLRMFFRFMKLMRAGMPGSFQTGRDYHPGCGPGIHTFYYYVGYF